jgi:hypothetical protein
METKEMKTIGKRPSAAGIQGLLSDPRIGRTEIDGQMWYSAVGVVAVLTDSEHPGATWATIKDREPSLARMMSHVIFESNNDTTQQQHEAIGLDGVLRLIQAINSPRAEKLKLWLAETAAQQLEEAENPELALLRARQLYQQRGYSRRWIEKRLRGVSARHELTGEWFRRGAHESDNFRQLTNELMHAAFGMDVEQYRRHKGLTGTTQLRDHMSDLELALTTLAETTAAVLHRDHESQGIDQLRSDVQHAGQIVAGTIADIERRGGKPVVHPARRRNDRSDLAA